MPRSKSSTSNGSASRYDSITGRGAAEGVSFSSAKEGLLPRAVDSILSVGDAVLLARTSDGGALVLRPIHDGFSRPIYASSLIELEEALVALIDLST